MQRIGGRTLMMAIQAVAAETRHLRDEIGDGGSPETPDLQELAMSYAAAAEELRNAYLVECRTAINLPPYEDLIGED